MRVYIASDIDKPSTGKGFFLSRLATEIEKMGVTLVRKSSDHCDIALHISKIKEKLPTINVLRLNGICHDTGKNIKLSNKPIRSSLRSSDAAI